MRFFQSATLTFTFTFTFTLAGALQLQAAAHATEAASFSIVASPQSQDLRGAADDLGLLRDIDPTVLTASADGSLSNSGNALNAPYFEPRQNIDLAQLRELMEDDSLPGVDPLPPVSVQQGADRYKGWRLADVIVRATKFRPRDGNTLGSYGVTSAVIVRGAQGRPVVFSFTELIRTENGAKTLVAFEKNGQALNSFSVIAAHDDDPAQRHVSALHQIELRNDFRPTMLATDAASIEEQRFQLRGAVRQPITIRADKVSATSGQGYYAVDRIGDKASKAFKTYHFQEYGPLLPTYWWGQGVRLSEVIDTAGLLSPDDKASCYVLARARSGRQAVFSCGELYNSSVGRGDAKAGAEQRSRRKGVLLVTDDLRSGFGNKVMMHCWDNIATCTVNNAGDAKSYRNEMDRDGNKINNQFIALVSTEDVIPFQPQGRWFPFGQSASGERLCPASSNCIPWISSAERMLQGIYSMEVIRVE